MCRAASVLRESHIHGDTARARIIHLDLRCKGKLRTIDVEWSFGVNSNVWVNKRCRNSVNQSFLPIEKSQEADILLLSEDQSTLHTKLVAPDRKVSDSASEDTSCCRPTFLEPLTGSVLKSLCGRVQSALVLFPVFFTPLLGIR
ncbi:hypothetical protein BaRGS_00009746 [Batillaria attramentaria]|uniref:Uncharacterized protein n=1 Tax=Batillaria attramentaria TaxID=370345 RepID=A0ABD0LHX1_9CAEN